MALVKKAFLPSCQALYKKIDTSLIFLSFQFEAGDIYKSQNALHIWSDFFGICFNIQKKKKKKGLENLPTSNKSLRCPRVAMERKNIYIYRGHVLQH